MKAQNAVLSRRELIAAAVGSTIWSRSPTRHDRFGADMIRVPGGTFLMGMDASEIDRKYAMYGPRVREMLRCETPRHRVTVATFLMDKHEVTNRAFREFVRSRPEWGKGRIPREFHNGAYLQLWEGDTFPTRLDNHPVIYVSWFAAMAYAGWAGKRLPLEAEWEYAARGGLPDAAYPWGDEPPNPRLANYSESGSGGVVAVEQYPPNGFGLYDMAGNTWEYCLDPWRPSYGSDWPQLEGDSLSSLLANWAAVRTRRVIRGGSWGGSALNLRVTFRDSHPPEGAGPHVGFRCVRGGTD